MREKREYIYHEKITLYGMYPLSKYEWSFLHPYILDGGSLPTLLLRRRHTIIFTYDVLVEFVLYVGCFEILYNFNSYRCRCKVTSLYITSVLYFNF